jgi:hypothetical protein
MPWVAIPFAIALPAAVVIAAALRYFAKTSWAATLVLGGLSLLILGGILLLLAAPPDF